MSQTEEGNEERFLSAQADRLAGASREEKASACSVRNDSGGGVSRYVGAKAPTPEEKGHDVSCPYKERDEQKRDSSLYKPTGSQERAGRKSVGLLRSE